MNHYLNFLNPFLKFIKWILNFKKGGVNWSFYFESIIKDLKGTIGAVSQEGRGSSFTIELPDVNFFEEEDLEDEADFEFFGDTVLIADDESMNLMLYKAFLSNHNLEIITAEDGLELIELAKRRLSLSLRILICLF